MSLAQRASRTGVRIAQFALAAVALAVVTASLVPWPSSEVVRECPPPDWTCRRNLERLAAHFAADRVERRDETPRSGPGLFLAWRVGSRRIRDGEEAVFLCPLDPAARQPATPADRARYETVDLDDPPRELCSFAVRDLERFPLDPGGAPQVLAVCVAPDGTPRHEAGLHVAWMDGSVRAVPLSEFTRRADAALVVGPGSPDPVLRVLRFGTTARGD